MSILKGNKREKEMYYNQLDCTISNKKLWIPMIIIQLYLTLILLLFIFGPWPWPINNNSLVYFYLFLAQMLLALGFFLSVRRKKITIYISQRNLIRIPTNYSVIFIRFLLILSFFIFIPSYLERSGLNAFNIIELF